MRSALSAPPEPTNRLAPLTLMETMSASFSVPSTALPVTTSAVAMSSVSVVTTATTLPGPMSIEAEPLACSRRALVRVSAGIRSCGSFALSVALAQSMRSPSARLVLFSFTVPLTCRSTPVTPMSAASVTFAWMPVKVSVADLTVAMSNAAPLTEKPVAPVVTTELRSPLSEPPRPTNRLAPVTAKASRFASLSVPSVALPVTTSTLAISSVSPAAGITATTAPRPMSSEPPATIESCCARSIASVGRRLLGVDGTLVALSQSMRSPSERLVLFSFAVPVTRRSTPVTPTSAASVTLA